MIKNSDIIKLVIAIFIFLFNPFDGKSQDRDVEEYVRIAIEDFCKRKHLKEPLSIFLNLEEQIYIHHAL